MKCEKEEHEDKLKPETHSNKLKSQGQNLTHVYLLLPLTSTIWEIFRNYCPSGFLFLTEQAIQGHPIIREAGENLAGVGYPAGS